MSERVNGDLPPEWDDLGREDSEALAPPPGAKDRVQRRVAVTLGLGAGFVAATAASSSAAAAGAAGAGAAGGAGAGGGTGAAATGIAGSLLAKKVLIVGVAAVVGVGGGTAAYLEVRSERARSQAPAVMPAPTPAPVARPVVPPAPEPSVPAPVDTLGEERTLLDRARLDIAQGRLADAGALLDRHATQFPAGQLAEEREALVIRLLVREGREQEARSRAVRFRQQHPRSIQLPGIDDALRGRR